MAVLAEPLPMTLMLAPVRTCETASTGRDTAAMAAALMDRRQTTLPKHLFVPGPDAAQLDMIFSAAATAPDHGQLLPWRLLQVPAASRAALAEVFADALLARDAQATDAQLTQAREKAHRAPLLWLLVVDGQRGDPEIDLHERIVSAGCAVQNLLLMATALGFASALTSGKALKSAGLRQLFALTDADHALCFVSIGTARACRPARLRPVPTDFVHCLSACGNSAPQPG